LTLDDGGTGLPDELKAACRDPDFCSEVTCSRLRYIQRNVAAPNVLTNVQLISPAPRNTLIVQVSKGKQIAVLEEATHRACRRCPIRPREYNQSAPPILRVPKVAAITCNVRISNMKISSSIDANDLAAWLP
jgi:hypothetical protein